MVMMMMMMMMLMLIVMATLCSSGILQVTDA
jgi:hypothetical protein